MAQKNDCEVIKGESEFFEPEEAKRVANGLKDCDLIVVTVKGFTWFGECINEFTKLGVRFAAGLFLSRKKRACCSLIQ